MLEWLLRGVAHRRVTTRYPDRPEAPPPGFHGPVAVTPAAGDGSLAAVCPTGAISVTPRGGYAVDRGRCVQCGACVRADAQRFRFAEVYETAARTRAALVVDGTPELNGRGRRELRAALADQVRALRRSVHIRHVDAGSDGAEEWEVNALLNPYYDIQRLGLFFTAAPRHADILLVTGGVTEPLRAPLERTYEVMPAPKAVVAVGTDACSGGLAVDGGVDRLLPVDVYVPGSPPAPIAILHGLLLAVGALREVPT